MRIYFNKRLARSRFAIENHRKTGQSNKSLSGRSLAFIKVTCLLLLAVRLALDLCRDRLALAVIQLPALFNFKDFLRVILVFVQAVPVYVSECLFHFFRLFNTLRIDNKPSLSSFRILLLQVYPTLKQLNKINNLIYLKIDLSS